MQRAIEYLEKLKAEAEENAESFKAGLEHESVWATDADAYDIAIRALKNAPGRTAVRPVASMLSEMYVALKEEGMDEKAALKICGEALGKTVGRVFRAD